MWSPGAIACGSWLLQDRVPRAPPPHRAKARVGDPGTSTPPREARVGDPGGCGPWVPKGLHGCHVKQCSASICANQRYDFFTRPCTQLKKCSSYNTLPQLITFVMTQCLFAIVNPRYYLRDKFSFHHPPRRARCPTGSGRVPKTKRQHKGRYTAVPPFRPARALCTTAP